MASTVVPDTIPASTVTASGGAAAMARASATVTPASRPLITATALGLGGVDLGVVVADPVDRPGVQDVLDRALQDADVGDQAEEEHGREHGERDRVEDLAQGGPLGHQGQATRVLDSAPMYRAVRPLPSLTATARAVCRVKCSVVSACMNACCRSGWGAGPLGWTDIVLTFCS